MIECIDAKALRRASEPCEIPSGQACHTAREANRSLSLSNVWRWLNPGDAVEALCSTVDLVMSGLVMSELDDLYPARTRRSSRE